MRTELWILLVVFLAVFFIPLFLQDSQYFWYYMTVPLLVILFYIVTWTIRWAKSVIKRNNEKND